MFEFRNLPYLMHFYFLYTPCDGMQPEQSWMLHINRDYAPHLFLSGSVLPWWWRALRTMQSGNQHGYTDMICFGIIRTERNILLFAYWNLMHCAFRITWIQYGIRWLVFSGARHSHIDAYYFSVNIIEIRYGVFFFLLLNSQIIFSEDQALGFCTSRNSLDFEQILKISKYRNRIVSFSSSITFQMTIECSATFRVSRAQSTYTCRYQSSKLQWYYIIFAAFKIEPNK